MQILFWIFIGILIIACLGAFTETGQRWQQEYFAMRETQRFMKTKGIKWP